MKRKDLDHFLSSILAMRAGASDEQSMTAVYVFPEWRPDTAYEAGEERIRDGYELYRCIQSHTSQTGWEPHNTPALWAKVSVVEWPEWAQPLMAEDAYNIGDRVGHNSKRWVSTVDNNVWEPGVYGWENVAG